MWILLFVNMALNHVTTAKNYLEVYFTIYVFVLLNHIKGQVSQHFRQSTNEQLTISVDPSATGKFFLCRSELRRRQWKVHFETALWGHLSYLCKQITFQAMCSLNAICIFSY